MSGFQQSTLTGEPADDGDEPVDPPVDAGVAAEELEGSLRSISIAEFFEKNKHMLGFDSDARSIITAVKEGVDNALDATEEAGILPDIYVEIKEAGDYYKLVIEDNGPGITKEQVPKIFGKLLYGSRFHTRAQSRGQQGIGISAAVLYSQLTSGKPAKITSRTEEGETAQQFNLLIDTDTNEPEIKDEKQVTWDRPHGTRIELEMEANMRSRQSLHQYVKNTATVNPHARLTFKEPKLDEPRVYERGTDEMPREVEEIKPHPHGVELGTVLKMLTATDSHSLSGFLQNEFTKVGSKTAENILNAFRDQHHGRELAWRFPSPETTAEEPRDDLHEAINAAASSKGGDAADTFATGVINRVFGERLTHTDIETAVDEAADEAEDETGKRFGPTVRENAVEAVWEAFTGERAREATVYAVIDNVTTSQKSDATVTALSERLHEKLEDVVEDERWRLTHDELTRAVGRAADLTVEYDDATFGETAREKVVDALWDLMGIVDDDVPLVREVKGDRDTASELLEAMQSTSVNRPSDKCLSPITPEVIEAGLRKEYDADFYSAATRDADVHGGDPFIVEAGIAYGGEIDSGKMQVNRFANRVPLVYQAGACGITQTVKSIGWRNYNLKQSGGSGIPDGNAVLVVHVASTNVPFTSESKDALASVPAIEHEVEQAVREVARDLKDYTNKRDRMRKRQQKQNVIADILPTMADKLASTAKRDTPDVEASLAKIMNSVHVDRETDGEDVILTISNYTSASQDVEVSDILSHEPAALSEGDVVDIDDEYVVQWSGSVDSDDEVEVTYTVDEEATSDVQVDDIESEKVTVSL